MKVCIFGSRELGEAKHYEGVCQAVEQSEFDVTEVVEGGAAGIDTLAANYAIINWLDHTKFYANWNRYKKAAGSLRNQRMAEYCEAGIALPGPNSRGTYDMINRLKKLGKPVFVANYFCWQGVGVDFWDSE